MLDIIIYFLLIFLLVSIPYRKIYNRLNQFIDAKTLLIGLAMMVFPFVWRFVSSDIPDAPSVSQTGFAGMTAAVGSFTVVLSWFIAIAGIVMIGVVFWTASEHQKKMERLNETHSNEN